MKILIVSGSRADRGLLEPVQKALGCEMVSVDQEGSLPVEIAANLTSVIGKVGAQMWRHEPDLIMILGDRYEIMQTAIVATIYGIPIAHIAGGDITEGSYDNQFRHAITKLSHIHFTLSEDSAARVRSMGEENVHVVGSPGLDGIADNLKSREELDLADRNILVCHYPATLGDVKEFDEVLAAVDEIDARKIFVLPNSDVGSDYAREKLKGRRYVYEGLSRRDFLSILKECDAMVGNSSAGLHEAPSLQTPTVNIGDRQKGRLSGASVIHCEAEKGAIVSAINKAMTGTFIYDNPYGDGNASKRIAEILKDYKPGRVKRWIST